mgnify:CR=1 FL=1
MSSLASSGGWRGGLNQAEGNFDPCATLSAVLVYPYGAAGSAPEQTLLFHKGQYLGTATKNAYAYIRLNKQQTTDSTVVLNFRETAGTCGACDSHVWRGADPDQIIELNFGPQGRSRVFPE